MPPLTQHNKKQTWREASDSFTKIINVYLCPEDTYNPAKYTAEHLPTSYAANVAGWGKVAPENNVITVVDARSYDGPEWNMTDAAFAPPTKRHLYTHKPGHLFIERPSCRLICLFDDGHVISLLPEQTLTPTNLWTHDNAPFTGQELSNALAVLKNAE